MLVAWMSLRTTHDEDSQRPAMCVVVGLLIYLGLLLLLLEGRLEHSGLLLGVLATPLA
jgi:hypothetical protein